MNDSQSAFTFENVLSKGLALFTRVHLATVEAKVQGAIFVYHHHQKAGVIRFVWDRKTYRTPYVFSYTPGVVSLDFTRAEATSLVQTCLQLAAADVVCDNRSDERLDPQDALNRVSLQVRKAHLRRPNIAERNGKRFLRLACIVNKEKLSTADLLNLTATVETWNKLALLWKESQKDTTLDSGSFTAMCEREIRAA